MLPTQTEHIFYDTNPPSQVAAPISLWDLGNRSVLGKAKPGLLLMTSQAH